MNLRERHKQTRRDQILDAAAKLIGSEGTDGVNMRTLAANANLSLATVYNLMGGQEEVLAAVLARAIDAIEAAIVEAPHADALAACLATISRSFVAFEARKAECKPALIVAHNLGAAKKHSEGGQSFKALETRATEMQTRAIRRAQDDGAFDADFDAEAIGRALFTSYIHHLMDWANSRDTVQVVAARAAFDAALILLSGAKGPARERLRQEILQLQAG
jgi:AcrR family transcriptional regulator